jgi:hypothetical protein
MQRPDTELLSVANPFKSLLLMQKCVLKIKGFEESHFREGAGPKKTAFLEVFNSVWLMVRAERGVTNGVSDAPPAAFSTHGLLGRGPMPMLKNQNQEPRNVFRFRLYLSFKR